MYERRLILIAELNSSESILGIGSSTASMGMERARRRNTWTNSFGGLPSTCYKDLAATSSQAASCGGLNIATTGVTWIQGDDGM